MIKHRRINFRKRKHYEMKMSFNIISNCLYASGTYCCKEKARSVDDIYCDEHRTLINKKLLEMTNKN